MYFKDLRSFLSKLEEEGQLVKYHEKFNPEPGMADAAAALVKMGEDAPAIMFDNLNGYAGKRVVIGVHYSHANNAIMMGHDKSMSMGDQIKWFGENWPRPNEGEVTYVENAPCQECVIEGEDVNLYEFLPLYRINPLDGGFYFPKGCIVSASPYDPDCLETTNVGIYRMQVQGKNYIGVNVSPLHDMGEHYAQAQEMGKPLPVCICLGNDPLLVTMGSSALPYDASEYKYVSALTGEPYELTKSTIDGLSIPANSEIIIEGEILPFERYPEGPFGEFPGTYSGMSNNSRFVVKRITHRKDPIYEAHYIGGRGGTESSMITAFNTCAQLYRQLHDDIPQVVGVNALYQHGMTTIVSAKMRCPGFAKTVAMRLASTPHGTDYCRNIIVVDDDVDPFNLTEVMWALSTRVRGAEDIFIVPNTPGVPGLLPADDFLLSRKLIIDATTPVAPDKFGKAKIIERWDCPHDDWEKIINDLRLAQDRKDRKEKPMKCLRCLRENVEKVADAPDGSGAWEVFHCLECNYSWRTDEPEQILDPEKRDPWGQLDRADFSTFRKSNYRVMRAHS